ncbi:hypothetical protein Oweho_0493 [Owenweeksia hongkongensis DSM 17368]|uniref:Uncharacterized protein n=1 Tax=Owenweeksia hongkongensis (strain DSM 17368 / CIP 108786 / JCM 12287 / NRRL B-23963 / UST20020801) TaxID=926562 RepID=G8QZR7_OWEHD|nr:hypothetical protein Oweho_0493 [Owenweeksia hongkongensis DSM 17368]
MTKGAGKNTNALRWGLNSFYGRFVYTGLGGVFFSGRLLRLKFAIHKLSISKIQRASNLPTSFKFLKFQLHIKKIITKKM